MDSILYIYISWTIHGTWMIYITFERGGWALRCWLLKFVARHNGPRGKLYFFGCLNVARRKSPRKLSVYNLAVARRKASMFNPSPFTPFPYTAMVRRLVVCKLVISKGAGLLACSATFWAGARTLHFWHSTLELDARHSSSKLVYSLPKKTEGTVWRAWGRYRLKLATVSLAVGAFERGNLWSGLTKYWGPGVGEVSWGTTNTPEYGR
jgi:hypothetical protein